MRGATKRRRRPDLTNAGERGASENRSTAALHGVRAIAVAWRRPFRAVMTLAGACAPAAEQRPIMMHKQRCAELAALRKLAQHDKHASATARIGAALMRACKE